MKIVLTKSFLKQALYEMGACDAIKLNTSNDVITLQQNMYSSKGVKMNDYGMLKTSDIDDKKILVYISK